MRNRTLKNLSVESGRRARWVLAVSLAITAIGWGMALFDLFLTITSIRGDIAPPSYAIAAILASSFGIGGLSIAIMVAFRWWQIWLAVFLTACLLPWSAVSVWHSIHMPEELIGNGLIFAACLIVFCYAYKWRNAIRE